MKPIVIAIDGPSGAGKTTTAKLVAQRLKFNYVDSGSGYRAICYLALSKNINLNDPLAIMSLFENNDIILNNGSVSFCGCNITGNLRNNDVSLNVSTISTYPEIRKYVTRLIQKQAKGKGIVVEGRDIGSVVFPDSPFKFFLDAEPSIRKQRRNGEEIEERDNKDKTRDIAPLIRPKDSLLIKTDNLSEDAVAERIVEKIRFCNKKNYFYSFAKIACYCIFKPYFRLSVKGEKNIPSTGPFILASNHLSYLDPPTIGVSIKRELHYFAKKELFFPIFGGIIKNLNAIPVDREGFNKDAIKRIVRILENGEAILIFPSGTRGENKAEKGIGLIASLSNKTIRTPIIPVKIMGTDKALGRKEFFIKPRKISVVIGKPIFPEMLDLKDYQKTADFVMNEIRRL
ncbi:MAG: (d)CMP kinase [bacterium]